MERPDIEEIFRVYADSATKRMTPDRLARFFAEEQKMVIGAEECAAIIRNHEPTEDKSAFSQLGFVQFLMFSELQVWESRFAIYIHIVRSGSLFRSSIFGIEIASLQTVPYLFQNFIIKRPSKFKLWCLLNSIMVVFMHVCTGSVGKGYQLYDNFWEETKYEGTELKQKLSFIL
jgi:hypothetical protein